MIIEFDAKDVTRSADAQQSLLRKLGVVAGDSIGWLAHNSLDTLGMLEACQNLDARFVPLNWRLAVPELVRIARHAGLQHLLHDEAHASLAREILALAPLPLPHTGDHQRGDVLLVYTSGTTGEPKGAIHTRVGMLANIETAIDCQGLSSSTRTLAVLPLFHVGGLCIQVLPTLAAGGRVHLHARFDPAAWLRDVQSWRPSTSLLVPATMQAIVEHQDWASTDLSSLSFVNCGSQIVPLALIQSFQTRGVPVAQVYGATETGPVSIVLRPSQAKQGAGRCGWPAKGVQVQLARDGEVLLKGANMMRTYHLAEANAFDAQGWFHTGDLARQHLDGSYEIVGRSKDLIISGGENIHPSEIENLLVQHPDIAECCAVGLPDARWGEVAALAVVPRPGHTIDEPGLRALFEAQLARFKHPRHILLLKVLPKTALGKAQRNLVREMFGTRDAQ